MQEPPLRAGPPGPFSLGEAHAYRGTALLVFIVIVLAFMSPEPAPTGVVSAIVAGVMAIAFVQIGLRAPKRVLWHCIIAGLVLAGVPAVLFLVVFLACLTSHEPLARLGVFMGWAAFVVLIAGLAIGLLMGLIGRTLLGLDENGALDRADSRAARMLAWIVPTVGLSAWFTLTFSEKNVARNKPLVVALLILAVAGGVVACLLIARDLHRMTWLRRVVAGHDRAWVTSPREIERALARFVAIEVSACDVMIAYRDEGAEKTPFRSSPRAEPYALIDGGATRAMKCIVRRLVATAILLTIALCAVGGALWGLFAC